ncbi:hypothetical protein M2273_005192 [Mucilaginibacter lappiensis]
MKHFYDISQERYNSLSICKCDIYYEIANNFSIFVSTFQNRYNQ